MIAKFDPAALHSRAALLKMLEPLGIDADAFVARIAPVKRFRMAWLGADLIHAMETAPPLAGSDEDGPAPNATPGGRTRRGKGGEDPGLEKLRRMARGEV